MAYPTPIRKNIKRAFCNACSAPMCRHINVAVCHGCNKRVVLRVRG